jgi:hypothetical protein
MFEVIKLEQRRKENNGLYIPQNRRKGNLDSHGSPIPSFLIYQNAVGFMFLLLFLAVSLLLDASSSAFYRDHKNR